MVAIGINALGFREVLDIAVGDSKALGLLASIFGLAHSRRLLGGSRVWSDCQPAGDL
jgi:hypothetical protein